jgi:hypothetical protein
MATSPPLFPILPRSSDDGEMPTALDIPQPPPTLLPWQSANDDIGSIAPTAPDIPPSPLIPIPAEPSKNNIASTAPNTLNTPLPLLAPQKHFVTSKSFEKDIVVLSMTYVLAENPEFKRLTDLIVAIHDNDEEDEVISSVHYPYWSLLISSSSLLSFSIFVLVSASNLLLLARLRLEKQ